ncbi:hypothetical protein TNCV_1894221 [Trichonephila clavipes]|nr:hypothetical protein TNCV_1894221 [Trichonephila clavipes]
MKNKQGTQQLEIRPSCEETQEESIRNSPESVVANGAVLARERKMKLTPPLGGVDNFDVNAHPNYTQSSRVYLKISSFYLLYIVTSSKDRTPQE